MSNITRFEDWSTSKIIPPKVDELVKAAHLLSKNTENIRFDSPHTQERLEQRGISIRQALEVLRKGECVSGPTLDQHGAWRIKLSRMVAGRRVQVVIAVKETHLDVITVI